MNIHSLQYFCSVAKHLNFSKAAEECHIAQTAMSRSIAAMEDELGFRLFDRTRHHVELTPAGAYFLKEAAQIDGANSFQTLMNVTIPMVMPSITICTFLTLTNSFKLFDQNFALTGGAPAKQTAMLALDIYNTFYGRIGFEGVGQAKAVVFFIMVALIAFVQLYITRRKEVES